MSKFRPPSSSFGTSPRNAATPLPVMPAGRFLRTSQPPATTQSVATAAGVEEAAPAQATAVRIPYGMGPRAAAPPTRASAINSIEENNPLRKFALLMACGYLFVLVSFIHEIIHIKFGFPTYLAVIFGFLSIITFAISGGIFRALRSNPVRIYLMMVGWMVLAVPFSSWPGGSLPVVWGFMTSQCLPLLFISGLVVSWKDFRMVLYAIAAGGLVNEYMAQFMNKFVDGRLRLQIVTIGNSNDLAAQLLMIVPLFWAVAGFPQLFRPIRWLFVLAIPFGLLLCVKTGSRGALVALAATYLFTVLFRAGWQRFAVAALGPMMALALLLMDPGKAIERFRDKGDSVTSEAVASTTQRTELLKKGVQFSLEHPIFGVGPGQFANYEGGTAVLRGLHGNWIVPHNSFIQISSENGLPALALMLTSLGMAMLLAYRVQAEGQRHGNEAVSRAGFCVMCAIVGFSASSFFLTLAMRFYFPLLIGLAVAVHSAAMHELQRAAQYQTRRR